MATQDQHKIFNKDFEKNFFCKFKKSALCWIWEGAIDSSGYGAIGLNKKTLKAHRVSWEIHNGQKIPQDTFVCHKCDNPKCVNPKHLFLGSSQDNIDDRNNKNRQAKGTKNGRSKLSEKDVIEIRKRHKPYCKKNGSTALAKEFKVSSQLISTVALNQSWKHLKEQQ